MSPITNLYAELKKSSTYTHTCLSLNTQIGRPLLRIVGAIGLFGFCEIHTTLCEYVHSYEVDS
jgi:hypothetical protein